MSSDELREFVEAEPLLAEHRAALFELRENVERLKQLIEESDEFTCPGSLQGVTIHRE